MTKKLTPLTLNDSGVTVQICGVSRITTILQVKREMPPPKPPLIKVEIAGQPQWERNDADPDFIDAFNKWDAMVNLETTQRMIKRLAIVQTLTAEQQAEVAEVREALEDEDLPKSDKLVWLTECAVGSDEDLRQMLQTAAGSVDPSQEGVNQASENFRR